jgi:tetratricopeptide (TPR) repeat protein
MSTDDSYEISPPYEAQHGRALDATIPVWPRAVVLKRRDALTAAFAANPADAIAAFTKLLAEYPGDHSALIGRGRSNEELGNLKLAIEDYEAVIKAFRPKSAIRPK